MHSVHTADTVLNDVGFAAMGILFSVDNYNVHLTDAEQKIIDTFFETLDWSKNDDPVVSLQTYGDLMEMVDLSNRWVYKGTNTMPPCEKYVYWNVLSTVYPIKQKYVDQFKSQQSRGEGGDLIAFGNNRKTNPVDNHEVARVTDTQLGSELK